MFSITLLNLDATAGPSLWDGWRGPGRDADVQDFNSPETWPGSLEPIWRVEVGGGYSTPIVADGRVFQQSRIEGEEVLWCLDVATGKVVWKVGTPVSFQPGGGGQRHGAGPKSTPTLADGRIFTLSITGLFTAWQAVDGKLLWQRDFKDLLTETYPYWGIATSPMVHEGRLFAHVGSCENGALVCLDPATGEAFWIQREHTNCYSSPLVEKIDGVEQLVEFNHHGLCGVDLDTGQVLWEFEYPHEGRSQNTPTPVYHDGVFILGAEDRGMFAVKVKRSDSGWNAEQLWEHREVSLDMSSPVVSEGVVHGFSHFKRGQLFGLDPASGEILWQGEPRMGENASLVAVPGHVLALTDRGELHVLRSSREKCDILETYQVGDRGTWTAPALIEDSLLIKDGETLVRWSVPQG